MFKTTLLYTCFYFYPHLLRTGECSPPINSNEGYHLIWIEDFKKGGRPNLQDHWFDIENLSLNKKKMDWYQEWLEKSREDVFWRSFPKHLFCSG